MAEVVARAQLAEAGLADAVAVDSAGTGDWHVGQAMNAGARAQLARRGYDGDAHRARQYAPSWLAGHDLVLAMDNSNFRDLRSLSRTARASWKHCPDSGRIRLFGDVTGLDGADVPDPYGGGPDEFARVLDLLESAMPKLIAQLAEVA
jgi:protein-tyrosine phosphatase